ncbi:hypothetical protein D3C84_258590 [compost metagenome]
MDIIALLQQALDASNKLRDLAKKVGDADFKMLVADLHSALGDAKLESGELKMKLAAAQDQIILLQAQIKQKADGKPTYTSEGVYSFDGETGRFCTSCWDVGERRVRLANVPSDFHFAGNGCAPSAMRTMVLKTDPMPSSPRSSRVKEISQEHRFSHVRDSHQPRPSTGAKIVGEGRFLTT